MLVKANPVLCNANNFEDSYNKESYPLITYLPHIFLQIPASDLKLTEA